VTGGGVFSLLANSIYTGETQIDFGSSLALTGAGAVANSSRVVADGIFNVSAATTPTIQSLAGSGSVLLGAQTLTITNANDTFGGVIG
ncbi:autotransporter outer membrane beta-barrel domain-containing protein, partial [Rhizobium ruizarguesonis]